MSSPDDYRRLSLPVRYDSGVAYARATIERKSSWSVEQGRPGGSDRDNFVTNRVTVADYDDCRASTAAGALGLSVTWACIRLIAGTIASLPLMVYRAGPDGSRRVARDHPVFERLHDSPNADQTAVDFLDFTASAIELAGSAFAPIDRIGDRIVALTPVRPDAMRVSRRSDGQLEYRWYEGGREQVGTARDVLHIRGPGGGPLGGASTLTMCAGSFHSANAVESASRSMFRNGVRPSGVLKMKDAFTTVEQREETESLLQSKFAGAMNSGRPMILDRDIDWQQLTINPEDAQMLESRRFSVEEICRIFGVPPHMVGHSEKSTSWGSGLEQQTIGFQTFTLRSRMKRIEQAFERQLLTTAERAAGMTIEFNLEGLLRGDSAARATFYKDMTGIGAMTINEVRAKENLAPVPGGDVPRLQMQNVPIAASDAAATTQSGAGE